MLLLAVAAALVLAFRYIMKIACWNVNSIKMRLAHLESWLKQHQPDIMLLQELKCIESEFPLLAIEQLGYKASVVGQRTYNGVALLSREKVEVLHTRLPGNDGDDQARYIEARTESGWRVASVYVPNGQEVGSDKFRHKLSFLSHLLRHLEQCTQVEDRFVIGGDFNAALDPIDVYDAKTASSQILFHADERAYIRKILNLGYTDCFRAMNEQTQEFSWWDYRGGAFDHNIGFRIDYLFASPRAADKLKSSSMDKTTRALEKPSDHIPVCAEFKS